MTQLDLLHSIEEKRDQAINERNSLIVHIQETGNTHHHQKRLSLLQGRIEAFNSILAEIRPVVVAELLKQWKGEGV